MGDTKGRATIMSGTIFIHGEDHSVACEGGKKQLVAAGLAAQHMFGVLMCCLVAMAADASPAVKKTPAEVIPITAANLRGHESLYNEGWFIVSSTDKALSYAKEHAITSTGQAMAHMQADIARHSSEFGKGLVEAGAGGVQTGVAVAKGGTALTGKELAVTGRMMQAESDYGSRGMRLAWQRFAKGNMTLAQRTAEDRAALAAVPGDYFRHLRDDFKNLHELTESAKDSMSTHIEGRWGEAYSEARAAFDEQYRQSGTRGNSLTGLGDIMVGYVKFLFSGLAKPATRSAVQGGEVTAKLATEVVFLPVAGVFVVTGRTVSSAGLSLYYTTSMGVKLVSPTVEGGLLAGVSLLSYGAIPATAVAGGAVGAVNQVAVTAAAPVAGAGQAVVAGAGETVRYAAQVSYDLVKGTTKVTMNQAQAGIALGYNALTAVPTQLVLGAVNSVVFLAWDGPRLVLATAKGEVRWRDPDGAEGSLPVQSLPVGTVVDLQALAKEPGVKVEVLSDDPGVVQGVLEKLPQDLRVGEKP